LPAKLRLARQKKTIGELIPAETVVYKSTMGSSVVPLQKLKRSMLNQVQRGAFQMGIRTKSFV